MKRILAIFLFVLLLTVPVMAQEYEDGGLEDLGEGMGSLAIGLLVLGSVYVLVRRLYSWSRNWSEENEPYKQGIMDFYRKSRKPLLISHNILMVLATIAGAIHGLAFLQKEDGFSVISGTLAWILMLLLSVFGFIIYYRLRPIWDNRKAKGFIRFIHRQWFLSVLMLIFLTIHLITA